jgi:tol-pal system protein YbgF
MLCAALSAASVLLGGCGRPESVADRQFAEMREQVTKLEAETDKLDKSMGPLETVAADDKLPSGAGPGAALSSAPPARVVQLGGPSEADPADPNDPSARTEIKVTGAAGSVTSRPRSGKSNVRGRGDDTDAPDGPRSPALDPDAKKAYETALAQLQAKQYDKGLEGLTAFLVRWPDHPYAENAMYWRGEAYFAQGEYLRAAEQFDAVIARFGSGTKAPDALLKVGMCHDRLGSSARAREYWDRLKREYPRSDAAKKIPPAARDAASGKTGSGDNSGSREDTVDRKGPKEK